MEREVTWTEPLPDGSGVIVNHRSEGCPPDDGLAPGASKFYLTIEDGKSSWLEAMIPCLIYINGFPRVFAWPGDRVAASVYRGGRQSLKVTRARKRRGTAVAPPA